MIHTGKIDGKSALFDMRFHKVCLLPPSVKLICTQSEGIIDAVNTITGESVIDWQDIPIGAKQIVIERVTPRSWQGEDRGLDVR